MTVPFRASAVSASLSLSTAGCLLDAALPPAVLYTESQFGADLSLFSADLSPVCAAALSPRYAALSPYCVVSYGALPTVGSLCVVELVTASLGAASGCLELFLVIVHRRCTPTYA